MATYLLQTPAWVYQQLSENKKDPEQIKKHILNSFAVAMDNILFDCPDDDELCLKALKPLIMEMDQLWRESSEKCSSISKVFKDPEMFSNLIKSKNPEWADQLLS